MQGGNVRGSTSAVPLLDCDNEPSWALEVSRPFSFGPGWTLGVISFLKSLAS